MKSDLSISSALVRKLDVAGPRYTSYPTVPVWSSGFGADSYARALADAAGRAAPLSLYVHIPFCRELCTYCGCNVVVSNDPTRADRYLDLLEREVAAVGTHLGRRRRVARLHLGGGTPTALHPGQLERLHRIVSDTFVIEADAELAVEIDPVVTTDEQLRLLAELGWTRLSMGVQDFDPTVQAAVRRIQTPEETRARLETARALGYRSVNFDLIYGLPHQTEVSFRRTLAQVIALRPDRLAVFNFAYVPQLKPQQRRLPVEALPSGEDKLAIYLAAREVLLAAGYQAIGMDHFALPGDELAVAQRQGRLWRDFQGYTTRRGSDTVAFGMSAISDLGCAYAQNAGTLKGWRAALESGRLPTHRGLFLSNDDVRRREVITQLMCNLRLPLDPELRSCFAPELESLRPLAEDGLVELGPQALVVTELGRLFVRNVAMVFDAYLRPDAGAPRVAFSRTV